MNQTASTRVFYGWWVVLAAFLNLFFAVGLVFYGLPVFYTSLVDSLHFTRSQVAQGLFLGFVIVAPAFGFMGALIDRIGARRVLRVGILLVALSLVLMGGMTRLWEYYVLCIVEVVGYVLAGPISNQVLVSNWFQVKRGRAMGYAYLGLGLGGVAAPVLAASPDRMVGMAARLRHHRRHDRSGAFSRCPVADAFCSGRNGPGCGWH